MNSSITKYISIFMKQLYNSFAKIRVFIFCKNGFFLIVIVAFCKVKFFKKIRQ